MLVQQSGADGAAMNQQKPAFDYQEYKSKYASDYTQFMPPPENGADDSSQDVDLQACAQMQQRAKVGDTAILVPMVLATAQMCAKEQELRTLRACQRAEVNTNVPAAYKRFAMQKIEDQFQERLAHLKSGNSSAHTVEAPSTEEVPVLLVTARMCESEGELRAWRAHQLKEINGYVPKDYQDLAKHTVERAFKHHLARIQEQAQKEKAEPVEQAKPKVQEQEEEPLEQAKPKAQKEQEPLEQAKPKAQKE